MSREMGTCGVDVREPDVDLVKTAMRLGWSVGLAFLGEAFTFAHLDRISDYSLSKPYQRLFFYESATSNQRIVWGEIYKNIANELVFINGL
jgi:hypothetical protein